MTDQKLLWRGILGYTIYLYLYMLLFTDFTS